MQFKPDMEKKTLPFFDDVKASEGWEGHTTSKSIEKLLSEISVNFSLVDCVYSGCQSGMFGDRHGFQIHFAMKNAEGNLYPARMDVACLPLKKSRRRSYNKTDPRIESTKKMALYMIAKAIKGAYFMSVLSPEYIPFMSMMLDNKGQTMGGAWVASGNLKALLPKTDEEFIESQEI